jgi:hypothetical protein
VHVRRRTGLAVGAVVVVVAVVAAGVGLFLTRSDDHPSAGCALLHPPTAAAGDGSGVAVVEQGYTRLPSSTTLVSMGAVLQNTTGKVAYRTRVRFDVLNPAGSSVVWANQQSFMTQEVPIILPGAKVSVGDALTLTETARQDAGAVARISVTATVSQWLAPGDGNDGLGAITTTTAAGASTRHPDGSGSVAYTTDNTNCARMIGRGTSMIFRNGSGAIIGGSLSTQPALFACQPGQNSSPDTAIATLRSIPASADLGKTQLTAYCDLDRPQPAGASDAPVN